MSSPGDSLVAPEPVFDRRFYPRTVPSSLTPAIFGPDISGKLIDLGENGFRLAAPFELSNNFVCRAMLPLSELERPIEVCVRVVWTSEANQAGIQFMDLTDEDRARIRKWAALQEKAPAPVETTEILNDAGTVADSSREPEPTHIQAAPVVSHKPRRKSRIGIAIAIGATCVIVLTATGFAVWASPLGRWVTSSLASGTKSVFVTKSRVPENASASQPLAQTIATGSPITGAAAIPKDDAMQLSDAKTTHLAAPKEIARQKTMTVKDAAKTFAGNKDSPQMKSVATANVLSATLTASEDGDSSRSEAPAQAGGNPDGDATRKSGEEKVESKPQTGSPATDTRQPSGVSDAASPASGVRTDFRPSRPAAPPATVFKDVPAEPAFVQTPAPRSSVVDVMLPNSPRPSVVSVPGERVIQSSALTLRIQRAIVAPAGHATWSAERKKRVVLGDLLSRVDPQAPRTADRAGSRVSVRVMLGRDGKVERLMPVNGPAELVPRVMRAVREWRFQPTLLDGKPVETAALITIEFRGTAAAAAKR